MLRLVTLISLLLLSLATAGGVSASVSYIPGTTIAMTGSNTDVRFDVASALHGYTALPPQLDTTTMTFSGVFYGKNIGWIEFSTGSYQVSLDCDDIDISTLSDSNICHLRGTGWNDNIGEIDFSNVVYNHTTGLLSGSATALDMTIDLSGIALPLRPVELTISEITASSDATLTVS